MNVNESRLRLLVVDSISSLITPILGGSGSQGTYPCMSITFSSPQWLTVVRVIMKNDSEIGVCRTRFDGGNWIFA
jgi:hypothetical protein